MIARFLSWLFPPVLPGRVRDWPEPEPYRTLTEEQGWAGNTKRRFTGLEKYVAEQRLEKYHASNRQWCEQLRDAETVIAAFEAQMTIEGYVNTMHDCWEKEKKGII